MTWLITIAIAALLYWYFILRPGRLDFWRVAARFPDEAYDHFNGSPYWKVFEGQVPEQQRNLLPNHEWVGPFRLVVPKLGGKTVLIYGKNPELEESQNEFLRSIQQRT